MIQETLEEVRKVERTELFNSIFSVVKQIPRKDVECDAMDASSCSYEIEQLFYKWQQERMYSEEEVQIMLYECLGHFAQKHNIIIKGNEIEQWFEQFKK